MVTLYVMSMESFAGKTVLCLGVSKEALQTMASA